MNKPFPYASSPSPANPFPGYIFTLTGEIMPAPRLNRKSAFVEPRAQKYLAIKDSLGYQFRQQMTANGWGIFPEDVPLFIAFDVTIPRNFVDRRGLHYCDWDNLTKAIQDAGNRIVYPDDIMIDQCLGFRRRLGIEWQTKVRVGVLNDLAT